MKLIPLSEISQILAFAIFALIQVQARIYEEGRTQPAAKNLTNYIVVYKQSASVINVIETRRWTIGNIRGRYNRLNVGSSLGMSVDVIDLSGSPLGPERAASVLARNPNVEFVEKDQQVYAQVTSQPNPPSWGLDRIDQRNLPLSGQYQYDDQGGAGSTIYIVDTGVRVENPEFEGRASWGADFTEEGLFDGDGHGTHCAGTAAGKTYGVAKKAKIVAVKVLDSTGSGTWSGVIAGMNWVVSNCTAGSRCVMSMSLGGGFSGAVNMAVQYAYNKGVVPVVAAGNENTNACWMSPASAAAAITVGATDSNDAMASWSNWGPCVDINAPGVRITSVTTCDNGATDCTGTWSGTSMATPHVAGVVALLWTKEAGTLRTPLLVTLRLRNIASAGVLRFVKWWTRNLMVYNGM